MAKQPTKAPFFYSVGLPCLLKERADDLRVTSQVHRLCVCASGSLITVILKFFRLIKFSCLHFGQNNGNSFNSVPLLTLTRVLLWQTGHNKNDSLISYLLFMHSLMIAPLTIKTAPAICIGNIVSPSSTAENNTAESGSIYPQIATV